MQCSSFFILQLSAPLCSNITRHEDALLCSSAVVGPTSFGQASRVEAHVAGIDTPSWHKSHIVSIWGRATNHRESCPCEQEIHVAHLGGHSRAHMDMSFSRGLLKKEKRCCEEVVSDVKKMSDPWAHDAHVIDFIYQAVFFSLFTVMMVSQSRTKCLHGLPLFSHQAHHCSSKESVLFFGEVGCRRVCSGALSQIIFSQLLGFQDCLRFAAHGRKVCK